MRVKPRGGKHVQLSSLSLARSVSVHESRVFVFASSSSGAYLLRSAAQSATICSSAPSPKRGLPNFAEDGYIYVSSCRRRFLRARARRRRLPRTVGSTLRWHSLCIGTSGLFYGCALSESVSVGFDGGRVDAFSRVINFFG